MEVWLITMAFPVPSEAFASVEVDALRRSGVRVHVMTLRRRRPDHDHVSGQQLAGFAEVDHARSTSTWKGLLEAARQPLLCMRLWGRLISTLWNRPTVLAGCLWWSLRCLEVAKAVRQERPDVLHLYWGHAPAILGWLLLETRPQQVVTTSLSAYDLELAIPISFEVARRCQGVRTWSAANRSILLTHGVEAGRLRVIHQGIDLQQFTGSAPARQKQPGLIAVASRLMPEKGIFEAIDIVGALIEDFPDTRLIVYGQGPQFAALSDHVKRRNLCEAIHFAGHVSHQQLADGLLQAEFFLLHSTHTAERLPNALKEAAAAGCCCLTTPTPDVDQFIRDRETGRILTPRDIDGWVDVLRDLRRDPILTRQMGVGASELVQKKFAAKSCASDLKQWWDRLRTEQIEAMAERVTDQKPASAEGQRLHREFVSAGKT